MYESIKPRRRERILYFVLSGLLAIVLGWLFYKSVIASVLLLAVPVKFYGRFCEYVVERKKETINMEFKDVLYAFSDTAASGRQADSAINAACRNMKRIYGEDNMLYEQLNTINIRIREMNESPERLLMEFAEDCEIDDIRNFLEIYCICINAGGDKEKAIAKAAGIISEKISLRQELKTIMVQKKLEAAILCCIPPVVLVFLQITSSSYAEVLFSTSVGRIIMTFCLAAMMFAAAMCLKIMDIKI